MIDRAAFRAIPVVSMGGVARYVVQYRVDFADACLVALSENFPTATIVTTDKRDFSIMRRFGRERIPFIAPELHGSGRVNRSARHKPRMITIKGTKGQLPVTAAR
jgi:hypothetical protein